MYGGMLEPMNDFNEKSRDPSLLMVIWISLMFAAEMWWREQSVGSVKSTIEKGVEEKRGRYARQAYLSL